MNTLRHNKDLKSISKLLVTSIIETLYQNGELSDDDIKDDTKIKNVLKEIIKNGKIELIIEHRDSIIESARHFKKLEDKNKAILFYAIFFEHSLNSIIEKTCAKRKIERKVISDIIKSVSIHGKTTWLLTLLDLPKLNDTHRSVILTVADERNSYVHYKWTPTADEPHNEAKQKDEKLYLQIEKTVTYLKAFESKIVFNKKKTHFKKNFKM